MINIARARKKIEEINARLHEKCDGKLHLDLDLYENMIRKRTNIALYDNSGTEIVLCLNYSTPSAYETRGSVHCVSSIACKINKKIGELEISSKTNEAYEGKKYNLLLRSVCFAVAPLITYTKPAMEPRFPPTVGRLTPPAPSFRSAKSRSYTRSNKTMSNKRTKLLSQTNPLYSVRSIVSYAINPISTFSLVKYFNAYNPDLSAYLDENNVIDRSKVSLDMITGFEVPMPDFMNEDEEYKYMKYNENFGNPLHLVIRLRDKTTINMIHNTLESTLARMVCP
jgi:hypothetical protein